MEVFKKDQLILMITLGMILLSIASSALPHLTGGWLKV